MQTWVLTIENLQAILDLEKSQAQTDDFEWEMKSWHASWRQESLEHYLPLGWSFGIFEEQKLKAYFLAQTLLFFRGMTQSLWVEHLSAANKESADHLIEVAVKMAKEKHFQNVLFQLNPDQRSWVEAYKPIWLTEEIAVIKTAKVI